jgi:hypothetical protein
VLVRDLGTALADLAQQQLLRLRDRKLSPRRPQRGEIRALAKVQLREMSIARYDDAGLDVADGAGVDGRAFEVTIDRAIQGPVPADDAVSREDP